MSEGPVVHILGNGKSVALYNMVAKKKGLTYTCNLPPFAVPEAKATFIVDFKMCKAIASGSVQVPGDWIMGFRPKKFVEMYPQLRLKWAPQIREFWLDKPDYAETYTDFNCGHMAVYYAAKKLKASEINMYGFDSIFNMDLTSVSDLVLNSDRGASNNNRLSSNWRPIWENMFKEFSGTTFNLYYMNEKIKINTGDNVKIKVVDKNKKAVFTVDANTG